MSDQTYSDLDAFFREEAWLMRLARRLVRDDAAAQDLVQETWAAALSTTIADKTQPRAWLGTVIRRLANKQREKQKPTFGHHLEEEVSTQQSPAETVQRFEAGNLLRSSIDSLEEPYKTTLLLRFQSELSQREIADQTGVSERTVRNRLKDGQAKLKAMLGPDFESGSSNWALVISPLLPRDFFTTKKTVSAGASAAGLRYAASFFGVLLVGATAIGAVSYFAGGQDPINAESASLVDSNPLQDANEATASADGQRQAAETASAPTTHEVDTALDEMHAAVVAPAGDPVRILSSESWFQLDGKGLPGGVVSVSNDGPDAPDVMPDVNGKATLHTVPGRTRVSLTRVYSQSDRRKRAHDGAPYFTRQITIPEKGEFEPIRLDIETGRLVLINAPDTLLQKPSPRLKSESHIQGFDYSSMTKERTGEGWTFYKVPAGETLVYELIGMVIHSTTEEPEVDEQTVFRTTYTINAGETLTVDLTTGEQVYTDRVDDY